ncbi:DUF2513 domain-containing protein [Limnobaculum parvum]|nr:DUF2513 domain-containing protein [Limnobaculum parvum]
MKRDLELLEVILLKVEQQPLGAPFITNKDFSNRDPALVAAHIQLLCDKHYVIAAQNGDDKWSISRITFDGYDYLDLLRGSTLT